MSQLKGILAQPFIPRFPNRNHSSLVSPTGALTQPFILSLSKDERLAYADIPQIIPLAQGRARAISRTPCGVVIGARHLSPMHT